MQKEVLAQEIHDAFHSDFVANMFKARWKYYQKFKGDLLHILKDMQDLVPMFAEDQQVVQSFIDRIEQYIESQKPKWAPTAEKAEAVETEVVEDPGVTEVAPVEKVESKSATTPKTPRKPASKKASKK